MRSPSISSLEKIAQALNTTVGYFFEKEERKGLVFIKKGMGKKSVDKERRISSESLSSGLLNIKIEPFVFTLGISAELTKEVAYPEGEKFGMVMNGKIELSCGDEQFILEEGDSIYCGFTQRIKKVVNVGEAEAKFLWIGFSPA